MNIDFAAGILKYVRTHFNAPGSLTTFLEDPVPAYRNKRAVHLGIVMEHRFAFCHWIEVKQKLMGKEKITDDSEFVAPDLVTFDWHDDFGVPDDYDEEQLKQLNQSDEGEVALFAWAALRALNDGHIRPAAYLNAIGNVYIVLKQDWDSGDDRDEVVKDRYGKDHHVFFFPTPKKMVKTFHETHSHSGVIWDLDLDYLTEAEEVPDQWNTPLLSNRAIKAVLSPKSEWMQVILSDLRAITIALEPEYTGGLAQSLHLFRQWERSFFEASVFDKHCPWKDVFD